MILGTIPGATERGHGRGTAHAQAQDAGNLKSSEQQSGNQGRGKQLSLSNKPAQRLSTS